MRDSSWMLLGGGALATAALWPARAHAGHPEVAALRDHFAAPPPATAPASPAPFDFGRPTSENVRTIVSSGWSRPRGQRLHRALDLPVPVGTTIHAIDAGMVVHVSPVDRGDAGIWVGVEHPSGVTSRYLHLSRALVRRDQRVERGDVVGRSGNTGLSTGPHLHLDLRVPRALLPTIARRIGTPRSGWGPELHPYGFSIPGEPWIPVDGYRDRVRRDAAAEGIPLHGAALRNAAFSYRPVAERGEPYPDWLRALRGQSGVYVIRDRASREILYVGQSGTGRLYETLTRHFQEWRRWKGFWRGQYAEGHDPGLTYPRASVEAAVRVTASDAALDEEARLIRRLRPRDNLLGQPVEDEAVPF